MSSDEIEKNDVVFNMTIYDSDQSEEDSDFELPDMQRNNRLQSVNEETEEVADILKILLEDVGKVEATGKNNLSVEFYNPRGIVFIDKNDSCDFDLNRDGYPLLPDGGEEFLLPFLKRISEIHLELKGMNIETNSNKFKFKV